MTRRIERHVLVNAALIAAMVGRSAPISASGPNPSSASWPGELTSDDVSLDPRMTTRKGVPSRQPHPEYPPAQTHRIVDR